MQQTILKATTGVSLVRNKMVVTTLLSATCALLSYAQFTAKDPGVRGGPSGAGGPLAGVSSDYQGFFAAAQSIFTRPDAVVNGLGPRFNGNACSQCHIQPEVGGSSPAQNPQMAEANDAGATNVVPPFITASGPVREVRFVQNPNGTPDGGVHDLFTITGRTDAVGCNIAQPDFTGAVAQGNAIFRIPTPTFGLGLVEQIPDSVILANAANPKKAQFGIAGHTNNSGNDGSITRFGWKAQNKSLLMFAGEAYNVEMGVTNELFPNERDYTPGCQLTKLPEDDTPTQLQNTTYTASGYQSDIVNFAMFMRLLAPPQPASPTPDTLAGAEIFGQIGCALCHTPQLTTGSSALTGMSQQPVNAFSDFLVHHMGRNLADGITQGSAGPDEFRTAPLWGVGQRLFFLHDGRTNDLVIAIREHASRGSEANQVIERYHSLPENKKQQLLDFLRSL
jgi:CxxC motif-containing protein (DUF1111 family)